MIVSTTDHAAHDPKRYTLPGVGQGLDAVAARRPACLIASVGLDAQAGDPRANLAGGADGFVAIGKLRTCSTISATVRSVEQVPSLCLSGQFDRRADTLVADAALVAAAGLPTVLIQDGGYLVERLGANMVAFLGGLDVL